ncbi:hypothetical protein BGZ76_010858 [Entomortierella beljakovae]|nr:hypothetical protein BGZ76_010858 [Entomortierella beljakovae]
MSNSANNHVSESTALLGDYPSAPAKNAKKSADGRSSYNGLWRPNYWTSVFVIFMVGFIAGPIVTLIVPFLKLLFCERGIPPYFSNGSDSTRGTPDNSDGHCDSAEYSAAIAKFMGFSISLSAVMTTLSVRYWSKLGDRIGRKRALQLCAFGSIVSVLLSLFVRLNKNVSLLFLILAESIEGATGSGMSYSALTHAYAADVTTPEERTVVFGRLFAGLYTGIALGSALGGVVAKKFGLYGVFIGMIPILNLINFLFITLMPESMSPSVLDISRDEQVDQPTVVVVEDESNIRRMQTTPPKTTMEHIRFHFDSFMHGLMPEQMPNRLAGKYSILLLMISMLFMTVAASGIMTQLSTYLIYRFHWNESMLSSMFTFMGVTRLFSMTLVLPLIKKLAPRSVLTDPVASIHFDLKLVVVGLLIEAITYFMLGATPYGEGFYFGGLISSVGAIFSPAIRGIITQSVTPENLGNAMGTLSTFESISIVGGPVLSGLLYSATLETLPSALFYASGSLALLATLLAFSVFRSHGSLTRKST